MQISLQFNRAKDGRAYLSIPILYRIMGLLFFLVCLVINIIGYLNPLTVTLAVMLLILAGYRDTWVFDKKSGDIKHISGWTFIVLKKKKTAISEVSKIFVDASSSYKRLVLLTRRDERIVLDIRKGAKSDFLEHNADKIKDFLGL